MKKTVLVFLSFYSSVGLAELLPGNSRLKEDTIEVYIRLFELSRGGDCKEVQRVFEDELSFLVGRDLCGNSGLRETEFNQIRGMIGMYFEGCDLPDARDRWVRFWETKGRLMCGSVKEIVAAEVLQQLRETLNERLFWKLMEPFKREVVNSEYLLSMIESTSVSLSLRGGKDGALRILRRMSDGYVQIDCDGFDQSYFRVAELTTFGNEENEARDAVLRGFGDEFPDAVEKYSTMLNYYWGLHYAAKEQRLNEVQHMVAAYQMFHNEGQMVDRLSYDVIARQLELYKTAGYINDKLEISEWLKELGRQDEIKGRKVR